MAQDSDDRWPSVWIALTVCYGFISLGWSPGSLTLNLLLLLLAWCGMIVAVVLAHAPDDPDQDDPRPRRQGEEP